MTTLAEYTNCALTRVEHMPVRLHFVCDIRGSSGIFDGKIFHV